MNEKSNLYNKFIMEKNNPDNNSVILAYWQHDKETLKNRVINSFIDNFIKEPLYDQIRTEE